MSLFKKKTAEVNNDSISGDGTHAVSHFSLADALMMFVIALLCCTCIFPFIHIIAKSFLQRGGGLPAGRVLAN